MRNSSNNVKHSLFLRVTGQTLIIKQKVMFIMMLQVQTGLGQRTRNDSSGDQRLWWAWVITTCYLGNTEKIIDLSQFSLTMFFFNIINIYESFHLSILLLSWETKKVVSAEILLPIWLHEVFIQSSLFIFEGLGCDLAHSARLSWPQCREGGTSIRALCVNALSL